MTQAKKKTRRKRRTQKSNDVPMQEEYLSLSREDLFSLLLCEEKLKATKAGLALEAERKKSIVLESKIREIEQDSIIKKAADTHRATASELSSLMKTLGGRYDVDTSKMTFDDETGIVFIDGNKILRSK